MEEEADGILYLFGLRDNDRKHYQKSLRLTLLSKVTLSTNEEVNKLTCWLGSFCFLKWGLTLVWIFQIGNATFCHCSGCAKSNFLGRRIWKDAISPRYHEFMGEALMTLCSNVWFDRIITIVNHTRYTYTMVQCITLYLQSHDNYRHASNLLQ